MLRLDRKSICGSRARLRLVGALLRRLGSLASGSRLAVRFHSAFIYTRNIILNIAERRRLFRRPLLNRTDACFDWAYSLSNVFLCRATRCETRTEKSQHSRSKYGCGSRCDRGFHLISSSALLCNLPATLQNQ
jgi:hypothetical protein